MKQKLKQLKAYLVSPITKLPLLLLGLGAKEVEKHGELQELVYTYTVDKDEYETMKDIQVTDKKLFSAVSLRDVFIGKKSETGEKNIYVQVCLPAIKTQGIFYPIRRWNYPIFLSLFYTLSLLSTIIFITRTYGVSMNKMVYFIVASWFLVLWALYTLVSKRYQVALFLGKEAYNKAELLNWLKENKYTFIDVESILASQDQLEERQENLTN